VGVPLNTLVMGTDCISKMVLSGSLDTAGRAPGEQLHEILYELQGATNSIDDMLRNCNIYQLLEEKKFVLVKAPFLLGDMFNGVDSMVRLQLKGLKLHFKLAPGIPEMVNGNCQLLTLFLVYIVLNCSRRSGVTSAVHIDINRGKRDEKKGDAPPPGIFPLTINVTDTGDRIEDAEAAGMFAAFETLETYGDLDMSYYSTLRLAIGREMLLLHGGSVKIIPRGEFAIGNTISINIPFEIVGDFVPGSRAGSPQDTDFSTGSSSYSLPKHENMQGRSLYTDGAKLAASETLEGFNIRFGRGGSLTGSTGTAPGRQSYALSSLPSAAPSTAPPSTAPPSNNPSAQNSACGDQPPYEFDTPTLSKPTTPFGTSTNTPTQTTRMVALPEDCASIKKESTSTEDLHALAFDECMTGLNTMVVDDTPSNRKMLQRLLANNKVGSDFACDGVEAVEHYDNRKKEYDLIFMDYTMPKMVCPYPTLT
jgi:CheY-like chemotaxis protein